MDWIVDLLLWLLWAVAAAAEGLRQAVAQMLALAATCGVGVVGVMLEAMTTMLLGLGAAALLLAVGLAFAWGHRSAGRRRRGI